MKVTCLPLNGALLIEPDVYRDSRGLFAETFRRSVAAEHGFDLDYVQENISYSRAAGTVRGLHWQARPFAQAKLVRVYSGAMLDVIVDIRRDSSTFGSHIAVRLDANSLHQLFVPEGFAHGLCTLEANTVVAYRVSAYFSSEHERGILWNDPQLEIDWPISSERAIVSDKDRNLPIFRDAEVFV